MSQNHKIAESLEKLALLVQSAAGNSAYFMGNHGLVGQANSALSFLIHLFLCEKCQGSGELIPSCMDGLKAGMNVIPAIVECPDCQGTGIKADVLDRLEAEEVTDTLKLQGCGDGHRQG